MPLRNAAPMNNYAYIDGQNLYAGVKQLGWTLDDKKFVAYLERKYAVKRAYYFVGYMPANAPIYARLGSAGYTLRFKPVVPAPGGVKGNVDADLVLQAMIDFAAYDRAVLVTGDGDFYSLAQHLADQGKLAMVLAPNRAYCSALLKQAAGGKLSFLQDIRHIVEKT